MIPRISIIDEPRILSRGDRAGSFQAFPDLCRAPDGDLICVFYAGYAHISLPRPGFERGGFLAAVRSSNDGATWSEPYVVYDGPEDNRDPHVSIVGGELVCSFFTYEPIEDEDPKLVAKLIRSRDAGRTWSHEPEVIATGFACSSAVRDLGGGLVLQMLYGARGVERHVAACPIGESPRPVCETSDACPDPTESDVIRLRDGRLFAPIRTNKHSMFAVTSIDEGNSWSPPAALGFPGHAPHLLRTRAGTILLSHRLPKTSLHISTDETATWHGPFVLAEDDGAYSSIVEIADNTFAVAYYRESDDGCVLTRRFRLEWE